MIRNQGKNQKIKKTRKRFFKKPPFKSDSTRQNATFRRRPIVQATNIPKTNNERYNLSTAGWEGSYSYPGCVHETPKATTVNLSRAVREYKWTRCAGWLACTLWYFTRKNNYVIKCDLDFVLMIPQMNRRQNGKEVKGQPIKTLTILSTNQNHRQVVSSLAAQPGKRLARTWLNF